MQTYIISSKAGNKTKSYLEEKLISDKIEKIDQDFIDFEKTVGIDDIRTLNKKIHLMPIKGTRKAVILNLKFGATTEAQNSMLKLLEEPPPSTDIYILTPNYLELIPTILSRSKIITIDSKYNLENNKLEKVVVLNDINEKFYLAQNIAKEKEEAVLWIEEVILETRKNMLEKITDPEESLFYKDLIINFQTTLNDLKNTNANPRLSLENLFLKI